MYKRPSVIVDIDGTLADCDHRLHHIRSDAPTDEEMSKTTDWDAFYQNAAEDKPIIPIVSLVKSLYDRDWCIILMTGRSSEYRRQTETWLEDNEINYHALFMRKPRDHTKDVDIKRAWYRMLKHGQISFPYADCPELAIEDRKRCIEMWRQEGLVALQCAKGDF